MTDLYTKPCCACSTDTDDYECDLCGRPVCLDCVCSNALFPLDSPAAQIPFSSLCPSCPGAFVRYLPTGGAQ